eukprot:CAMPEP_0172043904 /NCGR_PEP_ID=MMETSP1041-20130122/26509_1 /TAXON_ID=464988 /ORGANISM="Hemiselmis andersenii, Strain CCMP439" /LENGTH=92 /DNA_ID=CAMNT_0012702357 /DNA_START=277 /DNA_END=552 /DNA_ORIENTATION=-
MTRTAPPHHPGGSCSRSERLHSVDPVHLVGASASHLPHVPPELNLNPDRALAPPAHQLRLGRRLRCGSHRGDEEQTRHQPNGERRQRKGLAR